MQINWTVANPSPPYRGRVTIDQSDCTLISGTLYELDTNAIWAAIKAEEASETGIVFSDVQVRNSAYTVASVTYAAAILMLYEVVFTPDSQWSVILRNTNNDMWDVQSGILQQNQVQVIPTNSAGLVEVGVSGLTAGESAQLSQISTDARVAARGAKIAKRSNNPVGNPGTLEVYDPADDTLYASGDIWEDENATTGYRGNGIDRQDKLT